MNKKIKNIEEVIKEIEEAKSHGKLIVTTSGSFDILHYAHIDLLEKAKGEGNVLIVLLNSDSSIRINKGDKRPIVPQNERAKMLAALECVDYVSIFDDDKPLSYLEKIRPNIHVKGGSFIEERIKEERELIESWGGKYKTFELEEGYSTTKIINKIIEAYNV